MSKPKPKKPKGGAAQGRSWAPWMRGPWFALISVAVVGLLAYSNTFRSSFHLDDEISITRNPWIQQWFTLGALWKQSPGRFLTYLSFALNFRLGGLDVFGFHLVNIAAHLAAAFAVWLVVRQILQTPKMRGLGYPGSMEFVPLCAALLFVAHPLQTQAVTYIVQRATVFATLFYLMSIYFYGSARLAQAAGSSGTMVVLRFAASASFGILGLFSKETALTLPFAVALYELSFFETKGRRLWGYMLGFLGLFVIVPLFLVSRGLISLVVANAVPLQEYLLTQPGVWMTYLRLVVLPFGQNVDYDFPVSRTLFEFPALISVVALALLLFAGYKLFRSRRAVSFGIFWFFLTLLPESSFLPLPDVIFEHRMYLPLVGVFLAGALLLWEFAARRRDGAFLVLSLIAVISFAVVSYERNKVWSDEISLWQDVVEKSPGKARGYCGLGKARADAGRLREANTDLTIALRIDSLYGEAYTNRANVLTQLGQPDAAIADCNRAFALTRPPRSQLARMYFNRGTAYASKNSLDSALADLSITIGLDSTYPAAYHNRASVLRRQGNLPKALEDYSSTLALSPGHARAFNNRGMIYKEIGRVDEALADFNAAIRLQPDFSLAYLNRGMIWSVKNQMDRAIADYSDAIRYNGSLAQAYVERARAYVAVKRFDAAQSDLAKAGELGASIDLSLINAVRGAK